MRLSAGSPITRDSIIALGKEFERYFSGSPFIETWCYRSIRRPMSMWLGPKVTAERGRPWQDVA